MMDDKKIEHFREKLQAERKLLVEELGNVGVKNPDVPGDWEATPEEDGAQDPDRNVQADRYEEFGTRSGIEAELENRLVDVDRALQKIKNGTYGTCDTGGEPIEEDRLEANPAARTCKKHLGSKL